MRKTSKRATFQLSISLFTCIILIFVTGDIADWKKKLQVSQWSTYGIIQTRDHCRQVGICCSKLKYAITSNAITSNPRPVGVCYSNIAKNRVFRTFRLGLPENLTWWSNSVPRLGFYAKNYFGNDYRYFYNNHNLIFCRPVLYFPTLNAQLRVQFPSAKLLSIHLIKINMHKFIIIYSTGNRKTWARIPAQSKASFFHRKIFKFFKYWIHLHLFAI